MNLGLWARSRGAWLVACVGAAALLHGCGDDPATFHVDERPDDRDAGGDGDGDGDDDPKPNVLVDSHIDESDDCTRFDPEAVYILVGPKVIPLGALEQTNARLNRLHNPLTGLTCGMVGSNPAIRFDDGMLVHRVDTKMPLLGVGGSFRTFVPDDLDATAINFFENDLEDVAVSSACVPTGLQYGPFGLGQRCTSPSNNGFVLHDGTDYRLQEGDPSVGGLLVSLQRIVFFSRREVMSYRNEYFSGRIIGFDDPPLAMIAGRLRGEAIWIAAQKTATEHGLWEIGANSIVSADPTALRVGDYPSTPDTFGREARFDGYHSMSAIDDEGNLWRVNGLTTVILLPRDGDQADMIFDATDEFPGMEVIGLVTGGMDI